MKKLILIISMIGLVSTGHPNYIPCDATAHVDEVNVEPCDNPVQCVFKRGEQASINVLFTPPAAHEGITTNVYGIISGVKVPFPLKKCSDACDGCGITCPTVENKQLNFTVALDVQKTYPPLGLVAQLELHDKESKQNIICLKINVKID